MLQISAAEPCNSLSTGMQCEMDPVSQTQASERLAAKGLSVVGWYHSHPAFVPNPSAPAVAREKRREEKRDQRIS